MSARLYKLEPRDGTGVFLGLGVAECALLGAGFALTVLVRLAGAPVMASAAPLLIAVGLAKLGIAGRPLHQWLPLLVGWASAGATGRKRWRRPLPLLPGAQATSVELPPGLRGVDVVETLVGGREIALVRDRRATCVTAVVPVRGRQFAGTDPATQDMLLAGWGNVLAAHAAPGSPVTQIGWSHQATASNLAEHREWARHRTSVDDDTSTYTTLLDELAEIAVQHETVVWVTVSGRRIAGKGKLLERAEAALPGVLDTLQAGLEEAGLNADVPLSVPELWRLLRRRSDPIKATGLGPTASLAERMGLVGTPDGPPMAIDTTWNEVHIDGTWHRAFWVETWPRRPVPADWLAGFLVAESATMTVLHRPIEPARSQRRIESQLVKLSSHRARKEDKGRRVTEAEHRTEEAVHELESDLASGHSEMLYLGLVCVSAGSLEELDERCHAVEEAARAAQVGLRVLHGRQDIAWAATLPCGLAAPGTLDLVGP